MPNKQSSNQSIKRAFSILNAVAHSSGGISVTEISERTQLHKSTVSRMLSTLEEVNAVHRISHWDGYRIGDGLITLVAQVDLSRRLTAVAQPYLRELSQETGETINLAVPDGDLAHYVHQIDSRYNLQIRDWTGERIPLHGSVDGKIFLAYRPSEQIERYLSQPLQTFSPTTLTDPEQLRLNLAKIRQAGIAWTYGEYESGIVAIAAPIRDSEGSVIASICIGGPDFRFPAEGETQKVTALILDVKQKIESALL